MFVWCGVVPITCLDRMPPASQQHSQRLIHRACHVPTYLLTYLPIYIIYRDMCTAGKVGRKEREGITVKWIRVHAC